MGEYQGKQISESLVEATLAALEAGQMSQTAIGRKLRISQRTVGRIAKGMHASQQRKPRCAGCGGPAMAECLTCNAKQHRDRHSQPSIRCSGCQEPSRDLIHTSDQHAYCPSCHEAA